MPRPLSFAVLCALLAPLVAVVPTAAAFAGATDVATPTGRAASADVSDRLAPGDVDLLRADGARALALLAGGAECCPPPAVACACERAWKGRLWGSFTTTTGNTDTVAAVFGAEATWTRAPWLFKASAELLYGSDDGDTTAERYHALARLERAIGGGSTYVFGMLTFDRDEPAGLEHRFIPTLGVGRTLWKTDRDEWKAEIGGGVTIEKRTGTASTTDPSAYLGTHYVHTWADKRAFHADLDVFPNLDDSDLTVAKLALLFEMPVSEVLRVTTGLRFDYVVAPPDDREDLDVFFTVGVSANL